MWDTSTPAVVFGTLAHHGLGLMRSLGRMGVRVYGIDRDPSSPGMTSRYCFGKFLWDVEGSTPEENVEFLLRTGRRIGRRSVLYNFLDDGAVTIAEHADALREWFLFPRQSPDVTRALVSKREMYFLAKREGIPTAETLFPTSRQEVADLVDSLRFPIMLKGNDGSALRARTGVPMLIVRTARELMDAYDRMETPENPNLMLQEYIPGGDDSVWMFNGYFNDASECRFGCTGRKIRQTPIHTGATSLGIVLRNDDVDSVCRDFMRRISYRGILDMGCRYDARDGTYKVLDVNPRLGATFRLFAGDDGMDVARAAYLDLTGQSCPLSTMREGRKWLLEDRDLVSSVRYWRAGELTAGEWVRSFRGVEECAYLAADDPVPFGTMGWRLAVRLFGRRAAGSGTAPRREGRRPAPQRETPSSAAGVVTSTTVESARRDRD